MLSRPLLLSALAVCASAQQINTTFVTGLAQQLTDLGLTSLVQAINSTGNTPGTQLFLQNINGTSKTLLAPTNAAFSGLAANATSNTTLLGERLSYHLLSGSFPGSAFVYSPNHTIARTYLGDPGLVQLEGNKTQAMVFSIINNRTQVLNQNTVVTITDTKSYENLLIQIVDAVVDTPGTLSAAFASWSLTLLPQALDSVNFTQPLLNARGLTIFAPNDAALQNASSILPTLNTSTIETVISNHIINGTTAYSTLLGGSYTSAGGAGFSFKTNSSGTFVTSGNSTAKVIQADILLENGVMHIIDSVLLNTKSSPSAASSAYNAATSSAAHGGGGQTGGVGVQTPTATGSVGKSGAQSFIGSTSVIQIAVMFVGALAGAALLI